MIGESTNVMAAWEKRAGWLARWTMHRLLNRSDLWVKYLPVHKHRRGESGNPRVHRLAPLPAKRGKLKLTERVLERHYRGHDAGHILGIHAASADNTSKWIAINLERGDRPAVPLNNLRAATHWREELISLGFRPLMIDTDGAGGYCLLTLFRDPLPTPKAYDFVFRLVSDYSDAGLEDRPAILPDSATYDDDNWLRLPGRNPLTGHWSRVWNGRHWLQGADAVEALLHAHGDAPTLIRKLTVPTRAASSGGGNGATAAAPPRPEPRSAPRREPAQPTAQTPGAPGQDEEPRVLCYLLAATRGENSATAFAAVGAADISPAAFENPVYRHIFQALLTLGQQQSHITPTLIAQQIPDERRAAALEVIDQLIIQKPVSDDEFETLLANLSRRPGAASGAPGDSDRPVATESDSQVDQILQLWPRLSPAMRQALLTMAQSAGRD
jgi:hypothetical protein